MSVWIRSSVSFLECEWIIHIFTNSYESCRCSRVPAWFTAFLFCPYIPPNPSSFEQMHHFSSTLCTCFTHTHTHTHSLSLAEPEFGPVIYLLTKWYCSFQFIYNHPDKKPPRSFVSRILIALMWKIFQQCIIGVRVKGAIEIQSHTLFYHLVSMLCSN